MKKETDMEQIKQMVWQTIVKTKQAKINGYPTAAATYGEIQQKLKETILIIQKYELQQKISDIPTTNQH